MITEKELQTALQSFIGQEYNKWSTMSKIYCAVRDLLVTNGLSNNDIYYDDDGQTVVIKYKRMPLLEVTISKTMGKKHYGYYGGGWCEWSVKAISVFILGQDHTIDGRIQEIEEYLVKQAEAADKQLQEAIVAVKTLQAAFPSKSEYMLKDLIKYIADNKYTIFEQIHKAA